MVMYESSVDVLVQQDLQGVTNISEDRALELDITYVCNMACLQCNRGLGVLPGKDSVSVDQIKKLLDQLLEMDRPFHDIRILGGEPTLHPHLHEILDLLYEYKNKVEGCVVTLWSHGYGKKVQHNLTLLPDWLEVQISPKMPRVGGEGFEAFLAAPIDYKDQHDENYAKGCTYIGAGKCGVGFTPYGIYACPVQGAIDRLINLDIGIKDASEISTETFIMQCEKLCGYCGHYLSDNDIRVPVDTISPAWQEIIKQNKKKRPTISKF